MIKFRYLLSLAYVILAMVLQAQDQTSFSAFSLSDYKTDTEDPVYWKEIYNGPTIRAGYYHLKKNAKDDQSPHEHDEVYWIEQGRSKIRVGTEDHDVRSGDVIYVQAKQTHFFHDISEDLHILVLFAKGPFDVNDEIAQIDAIEKIEAKRNGAENTWNDFLKKKSMTFGLYMLPGPLGGDQALTHAFDEINFVIKGTARFVAGENEIDVSPGSLFVVPKGMPHYFKTDKGIDVFILFEKKSVN